MRTFDEAVTLVITSNYVENGKVAFNEDINANTYLQNVLNIFTDLTIVDSKRSIDCSFVLGLIIGLKMNEQDIEKLA